LTGFAPFFVVYYFRPRRCSDGQSQTTRFAAKSGDLCAAFSSYPNHHRDVLFARELVFIFGLAFEFAFLLAFEFAFLFVFPVLPIFAFTVEAGVGVLVGVFAAKLLFAFRTLFEFVLLSAPQPNITAEPITHRPVANSFLI
jgi:hypothetical protein